MKRVFRGIVVLGIGALIACEDAVGPSGGITVTGVVVDENLNPQGSVGVLITGHRQVTTDASGRFSVNGVQTPYELATWFHHERAALVTRTGVTLAHRARARDIAVPLTPVATGSISGSVNMPDSYVVTARSLFAGFAASPRWTVGLEVLRDAGDASSFNYVAPALPGAPFALWARAKAGAASVDVLETGIAGNAADVVLDMPAAPVLIEPAAGATDVHNATRFSWTGLGDAVYLLSIRYIGPDIIIPYPPNYYVLTTDTTATVPDLSQFGLFFYRGTAYVWEVFAWAPVESVDNIMIETWVIPQGDVRAARSAPRNFTTMR